MVVRESRSRGNVPVLSSRSVFPPPCVLDSPAGLKFPRTTYPGFRRMVKAALKMKDMAISNPSPVLEPLKPKKKALMATCARRIAPLLKDIEQAWDTIVPGLVVELSVHRKLLIRIKHQFRSSKIVQRSQSVQACARRLMSLRHLDLQATARKLSFSEGVPAVLSRVRDARALISQMSAYAQLVAEGSTQALAQEHYFFFGSDLSILATSSRIWTISRLLLDKIDKFSKGMGVLSEEFSSITKKFKTLDASFQMPTEDVRKRASKKVKRKSKTSTGALPGFCDVARKLPTCSPVGVLSRFTCPEVIISR